MTYDRHPSDFRLKAEATRYWLRLVASGFSRKIGHAILIQLLHATSTTLLDPLIDLFC